MTSKLILAVLYVTHPDKPEQKIEITTTPFRIGRGEEDNDFPFPEEDLQISRRHAQLIFEPQRILLTDLDSSDGTFIDGQQLDPDKSHPISYGDKFNIGDYTLHLEKAPASPLTLSGSELLSQIVEPDYERVFGVSNPCRYLQYLPPLYHDEDFLDLFLRALEVILTSIEQKVDNFDLYLDPKTTPAFFLDQLAVWVDLILDEQWPEAKRRALLARAGFLHEWQGTKRGLSEHIRIYTDLMPEIIEPESQPHHFEVVLRVPRDHPPVDTATVERIIKENKPAHTTYELKVN